MAAIHGNNSIRAAIFSVALIATAAFGGLKLYYDWHETGISTFVVIEFAALCLVCGVSTANYYSTFTLLTAAGQNIEEYKPVVWAVVNVFLFISAALALEITEIHLLCILFIYLSFTVVNRLQVKNLTDTSKIPAATEPMDKRKIHYMATVMGAIWLDEENGPSTFAFTIVMILLFVITIVHLASKGHTISDNFYYQIKAFAGGAATFHLVLSVRKYRVIVKKQDVVEEVLDEVGADTLTTRIITLFNDYCKLWKWLLPILGVVSLLFAIVTWQLNVQNHRVSSVPEPQSNSPKKDASPPASPENNINQ